VIHVPEEKTGMKSPRNMKAAVLHAFNTLLMIESVGTPQIGPDEVLVRTMACGMCATDLHLVEEMGYRPKLPHILGHEPVGVVAEIGENVMDLEPGDRVVPNILFTCGKCFFCRTGRESICVDFPGPLGLGHNGGFAEYFKAPARNLFKIPETIGFPEAAPIGCAVVTAVHAVRRRAQVVADETVLVIGTGGVGQNVMQVAHHAGANVIALVRRDSRAEQATRMGAHHVINVSKVDLVDQIRRVTNGAMVDKVIDCIGTQETIRHAVASLRHGGRIVMIGETNDPIPLPTFRLAVDELEIIGSRNGGRQDTVEAIQLMAQGKVKPFISDIFSLEQINTALDTLRQGKAMGRIVIRLD
jgi:D-arabinose 1-dehydrogenase-like Zn-dependent alcohol dehydrogenase